MNGRRIEAAGTDAELVAQGLGKTITVFGDADGVLVEHVDGTGGD